MFINEDCDQVLVDVVKKFSGSIKKNADSCEDNSKRWSLYKKKTNRFLVALARYKLAVDGFFPNQINIIC